jgi:hypothetical protein
MPADEERCKMKQTLSHPAGYVHIEELGNEMRRVTIDLADPKKFCPVRQWDSRYPVELIRNLMETTGPAWLCDELRRDEDPTMSSAICGSRSCRSLARRTCHAGGCSILAADAALRLRFWVAWLPRASLSAWSCPNPLSAFRASAPHFTG